MTAQGENSIIHRKTRGGRDQFAARVMSPAKALRLSLAKSAARLFDLVITVTTVEQLPLVHANVQKEAGTEGLLILLDGANGARGAIRFDAQFLTALIEVQTTGVVQAAEAAPRPMTRTDAAMVSPIIDALLKGYDAQLSEASPEFQAMGFRFGDKIENGRALSLILDAPDYDLFRLNVDLAEGAKTGAMTLILPVPPPAPAKTRGNRAQTGGDNGLKGNALDAPVTLDAVMARISLPLREICGFAPGTIVLIPAECLRKTELVAAGDHVVSKVLLGQLNGLRAVRFAPTTTEPAPDRPALGEVTDMPNMLSTGLETGDDALEGSAMEIGDPLAAIDMPGMDAELPDFPMGTMPEAGAGDLPDLPLQPMAAPMPDLDLPDLGQPMAALPDLDALQEDA